MSELVWVGGSVALATAAVLGWAVKKHVAMQREQREQIDNMESVRRQAQVDAARDFDSLYMRDRYDFEGAETGRHIGRFATHKVVPREGKPPATTPAVRPLDDDDDDTSLLSTLTTMEAIDTMADSSPSTDMNDSLDTSSSYDSSSTDSGSDFSGGDGGSSGGGGADGGW